MGNDDSSAEAKHSEGFDFAENARQIHALVARHAHAELKVSPATYLDYSPIKELRYCDLGTWGEIRDAADEALKDFGCELLNVDEILNAPSDVAIDKAKAIGMARCGVSIEERLPGLLEKAVREGWLVFLEKLHRSHAERPKPTVGESWQLVLILFWYQPLPGAMARYWPFCFWSDEAIVGFLDTMGGNVSLDQWRKFRRAKGLRRPLYTVIAEVVQEFNGSAEDGLERECDGFRVVRRVRRLPKAYLA